MADRRLADVDSRTRCNRREQASESRSSRPTTVSEAVDRFLDIMVRSTRTEVSRRCRIWNLAEVPNKLSSGRILQGASESLNLADVTVDYSRIFVDAKDRAGDLESRIAGAADLLRLLRQPQVDRRPIRPRR